MQRFGSIDRLNQTVINFDAIARRVGSLTQFGNCTV
jgi:hypothetical protein